MHRILAIVLALLPALASSATAQDRSPAELEDIRAAFAAADAGRLLAHAGERIEIGLYGSTRTYSRSQARFVLDGFFEESPPESIVLERATGTDQGWFAAARYVSSRVRNPIRIYIRLRRVDDVWRLRELVIREET